MTEAQKRSMAKGRKSALRQRTRGSVARVKTYRTWLSQGARLAAMPQCPTDEDYRRARAAGAIA